MRKRNRKKKGSWLSSLFLVLLFLAGAGILCYPVFSDLWNSYRNQRLISDYSEAIKVMEPEDYSELWEAARAYNANHRTNTIVDAFDEEETSSAPEDSPGTELETSSASQIFPEKETTSLYEQVLNPAGNGVMGYVEIPKINVKLAIYHGIGTKALENGCGHIEGTSLPIGGKGTHAVLSAHRGLPSAKLFTDLDQVREGDLFYITVLDETLAYQVKEILTVLPEETKDLEIEQNEDLVTLVTCTPYGVNSHRLLVRGARTEYVPEEITKQPGIILRNPLEGTNHIQTLFVIGLLAFVVFLIILGICLKISDRRKRKRKKEDDERKENNPIER